MVLHQQVARAALPWSNALGAGSVRVAKWRGQRKLWLSEDDPDGLHFRLVKADVRTCLLSDSLSDLAYSFVITLGPKYPDIARFTRRGKAVGKSGASKPLCSAVSR